MDLKTYIKSKGLTLNLVAQEMGVKRQALAKYGKEFVPTSKTLKKVADAMTTLGVPTTVVDLVPLFIH